MKYLNIILFVIAITFGSFIALAEKKEVCVEFNGTHYCETVTTITIGDTEIPIDDPFSLLDSITNSEVEKIGLWDHYKYPAVIVELAKQLKISEDDLIILLKDADPNWKALYNLTMQYEDLRGQLNKYNLTSFDVDRLFEMIIYEIVQDIKEQLKDYEGKTNV